MVGCRSLIGASVLGAWAGDTLGSRLGVSLWTIGDFQLLAALIGSGIGIAVVSVVAVLGPTETAPVSDDRDTTAKFLRGLTIGALLGALVVGLRSSCPAGSIAWRPARPGH